MQCTFCGNSAQHGAVASFYTVWHMTFERCLIAFNGAGGVVNGSPISSFQIACCDIYGNTGGDWVGALAGHLGINGNISADPLFCDPAAGDYTIDCTSPCAPFTPPNPECDLIGAWPVGCNLQTVEEPAPAVAGGFRLAAAGPFAEQTWVVFDVPAAAGRMPVKIFVFDVAGRQVQTLLDGVPGPGSHRVLWDGRDDGRQRLAGGVYYCLLRAGATELRRGLVLLR